MVATANRFLVPPASERWLCCEREVRDKEGEGGSVDDTRQRAAAEVLELGEALFDELMEAAAKGRTEGDEDDPFPAEDVRAASVEFFRALRVVLDIDTDAKGWERR